MNKIHAFVLSLFLLFGMTAPALADNHKPDKSRSAEHRQDKKASPSPSKTRGNSPSDPDDDGKGTDRSNGGPDKPDGNNGCGNNEDREDDNNGWCGRKPEKVTPTSTYVPTPTMTVSPTTPTETPKASPSNKGATRTVPVGTPTTTDYYLPTGELVRTGSDVTSWLVGGLVLVVVGCVIVFLTIDRD